MGPGHVSPTTTSHAQDRTRSGEIVTTAITHADSKVICNHRHNALDRPGKPPTYGGRSTSRGNANDTIGQYTYIFGSITAAVFGNLSDLCIVACGQPNNTCEGGRTLPFLMKWEGRTRGTEPWWAKALTQAHQTQAPRAFLTPNSRKRARSSTLWLGLDPIGRWAILDVAPSLLKAVLTVPAIAGKRPPRARSDVPPKTPSRHLVPSNRGSVNTISFLLTNVRRNSPVALISVSLAKLVFSGRNAPAQSPHILIAPREEARVAAALPPHTVTCSVSCKENIQAMVNPLGTLSDPFPEETDHEMQPCIADTLPTNAD